jgi:hypothetical protein
MTLSSDKVKKGMSHLIVLLKGLPDLDEVRLALQNVDKISGKYVFVGEATFIV